jgi:hypothetical protein
MGFEDLLFYGKMSSLTPFDNSGLKLTNPNQSTMLELTECCAWSSVVNRIFQYHELPLSQIIHLTGRI